MLKIGHRGWRGNYPENTILSIKKAFELKIDGVEIDIVVNGSKQLTLSHEPWMNKLYCQPGGKEYNMFKMSQDQIILHDCGELYYADFPHQNKIACSKPLLKDVLEEIDWSNKYLFLEIKSNPKGDNTYHPPPKEYARIVSNELKYHEYINKVYFMSFDDRILHELRTIQPQWKLVYLFDKEPTIPLQFTAIGPAYHLINPLKIKKWMRKNLEIYTWTVNEIEDLKKCQDLNLNGVISDFPNRLFG